MNDSIQIWSRAKGVVAAGLVLALVALSWAQEEGVPGAQSTPATQAASSTQPMAATQPSGRVVMPAGANVAIIDVEGLIYSFVLDSLERRIDRAVRDGASVIVIELNTPGGAVPDALRISKYIKALPVPTIAWVNNEAYSAGIMLASACDQIVMSPASATGDCAPILLGQEMAPTERAKALSPILEEFRDNAANNGYDYAMFHAMCVLGVELYQVKNKETGEEHVVNQIDYRVMVLGMSPETAAAPGRGLGGLFGLGGSGGAADTTEVGAAALDIATDADRGQWELVKQVHDGRTLFTVNQSRALEIGLSQATIGSEAELQQYLGAKAVVRVPQTWSEDLAGFLTSPVVRAVLIMALLLGAYLEMQTPGVGVPGAIAAAALIILLGAPFVVGLAEVWHIVLFLIGLVLLIIELAFVPGFGLIGVAGLVMMFAGLVLSVVPTTGGPSFGPIRLPGPYMWDRLLVSSFSMILGLLASLVGFFVLTKYFGQLPLLSRLILDSPPAGAMASAGGLAIHVSGDEAIGGGTIDVGDLGESLTPLHPAGQAVIRGATVDVVTLGGWIDPNQRLKVVEVHGNRIVVEAAD